MLSNCSVREDSESPLDLSNQSILKEINSKYLLKGLMLKLKLQYCGHLMWRADSLEKSLMLGKTEGRRRGGGRGWDGWMASLTQWTWVWANFMRQWRRGKPGMLQSMGSPRVIHDWATKQQHYQKRRVVGGGLLIQWCDDIIKSNMLPCLCALTLASSWAWFPGWFLMVIGWLPV